MMMITVINNCWLLGCGDLYQTCTLYLRMGKSWPPPLLPPNPHLSRLGGGRGRGWPRAPCVWVRVYPATISSGGCVSGGGRVEWLAALWPLPNAHPPPPPSSTPHSSSTRGGGNYFRARPDKVPSTISPKKSFLQKKWWWEDTCEVENTGKKTGEIGDCVRVMRPFCLPEFWHISVLLTVSWWLKGGFKWYIKKLSSVYYQAKCNFPFCNFTLQKQKFTLSDLWKMAKSSFLSPTCNKPSFFCGYDKEIPVIYAGVINRR